MIAPLGKHLRKWLLGLALAARNRVQAVVAALESAEKEQSVKAGPEIASGAAKKARPGGPPDHWVQLVARHAPELLQSGPPELVRRPPSAVSDSDAGLDGSPPEDIRELKSDSRALAQEDQSRSFALSRAPKEYDDQGRKRQSRAQDHPGQAGANNGMAGVDATSPDQPRDVSAVRGPVAARLGPVRADRPSVSPASEEKTMHRRTSGREQDGRSVPPQGAGNGSHEAKSPDKHTVAARRFQSTSRQIENLQAGVRRQKDILATEPSARRGEPGYPKSPEYGADSQVDTRMPLHRKMEQEVGSDSQSESGKASRGMASAQDTQVKITASQIPGSGYDVGPVSEVRVSNGQRSAYSPRDTEKVDGKVAPPAELSWPSLPGETDFEDVRDSRLAATWPDLPEKPSAEVLSSSNQLEFHPTEAASRNIERLRRLDEEQKGIPWSESHF